MARAALAAGLSGFRYFGFRPPAFPDSRPVAVPASPVADAQAAPPPTPRPPPEPAPAPIRAEAPQPPPPRPGSGFPLLAELAGTARGRAAPAPRHAVRRPGAFAALRKLRLEQDS